MSDNKTPHRCLDINCDTVIAGDQANVLCSQCLLSSPKPPTVTISRECVWTREDFEYGHYNSECGHSFELNDGDLDSNGFKFCYSCGGKIKEKAMEVQGG